MTKNNHIYFILQFDPLKHSINNSSCNLTYTPKIIVLFFLGVYYIIYYLCTIKYLFNLYYYEKDVYYYAFGFFVDVFVFRML